MKVLPVKLIIKYFQFLNRYFELFNNSVNLLSSYLKIWLFIIYIT